MFLTLTKNSVGVKHYIVALLGTLASPDIYIYGGAVTYSKPCQISKMDGFAAKRKIFDVW